MSLIEKSTSHHFSSLFHQKKPHRPNAQPFDEALIRRLKSLAASLPLSSQSLPLSFLVRAADLLSSTLDAAADLLLDPTLPKSSSSAHLDASVALLDSINLVTSRIDRVSRLRLHVTFALHLVASGDPVRTRKARDSLAEWTANLRSPHPSSPAAGLIRSEIPPRGKITVARRAIYAVEAVSALVVGILLSSLGVRADLEKVRVSGEFAWAEAFKGVAAAVRGSADGRFAAEIEALDSSLGSSTEEVRERAEELTEGLDRLGSAVDGLFRSALCERDAVLQGFRLGPRKCSYEI